MVKRPCPMVEEGDIVPNAAYDNKSPLGRFPSHHLGLCYVNVLNEWLESTNPPDR